MTELVNQQYREKHQTEHLQHSFLPVIQDSASVAWDMLTLFPPAVLCTPEKYHEEWHDKVGSLGDRKRYYKLVYYRPLMLNHAHGSVAEKAIVKRLASSEPTPNEDSDYEDDGMWLSISTVVTSSIKCMTWHCTALSVWSSVSFLTL